MKNLLIGDLRKYKKYSGKSTFYLVITQQGLWAIIVYRITNGIYKSTIPKILKNLLLGLGVLFQKFIEVVAGISIPYSVQIGKEFYIGHFGGIIINSNAIIGDNCNISQGVTIGVSGKGEKRGVPTIGNNVYIGANSVVAGAISIGDNSVISANSLVTRDVLPNLTVMGVPAIKISDNNSAQYI